MNLYQKLTALKSQISGFYKDVSKPGITYKYVSGSQILKEINPIMNELGIVLIPKTTLHRGWEKHEYTTKRGDSKLDFIVDGELSYLLINTEDPTDQLEIKWQYYGQQDEISKAYGSALTYAERYLLLKLLGLPTDEDDPDGKENNEPSHNQTAKPQNQTYKPVELKPQAPIKETVKTQPQAQQAPQTPIQTHEQPKQQMTDPEMAKKVADAESRDIFARVVIPYLKNSLKNAGATEEELATALKIYPTRFLNEVIKLPINEGKIVNLELSETKRKPYQTGGNVVVVDDEFKRLLDEFVKSQYLF